MRSLFLICFINSFGWTQVLDNCNGLAFTDQPFFNCEFIQKNKLKSLIGTFNYKKPGQTIRETKYKYVYEFDSLGRLVNAFETRKDDGTEDTTWNKYQYNNDNQLAVHRKGDGFGYTTKQYTYDSLGRIVEEALYREVIDSASREITRVLDFNKEKREYYQYDKQLKSTYYNSYNLPYKEEFVNYNDAGYLVERTERLKMTSDVRIHEYSYNEKGLLGAIRVKNPKKEGYIEENLFKYDDFGNLIEKHIYRNGVFITDMQFIYNSKTKLLTAVLTREVSTDFIMIIRFLDYEFYS